MQNLNIYNIIILLGVIHGFIFSLILFINPKLKSRTNSFLALTVLSLSFSNFQYFLKDIEVYPSNLNLIFIPFEFLMLPFFFFYVKSYLEKKISLASKILLLSPFFYFIFHQLFFREHLLNYKTIEILNVIIEYISIIFTVFLIVIVFRSLISYEKLNINNKIAIETKWLKNILIIGLILCLIWFVSINLFVHLFGYGYYQYYPLWIGISILIYWLAYTSIFKTLVYNQRKNIRKSLEKRKLNNEAYNNNNNTFHKIDNLIKNKELYLDPKLSLGDISSNLDISIGYASQLINKHTNTNFNDFINSYRVERAKMMLDDITFDNYTIVAIGLESGFNSKSSFYTAFKKFTGETPSAYKKNVRNN